MVHTCFSAAIAFLPVVLSLQECYVCKSAKDYGHAELEFQFPGEHIDVCQKGVTPASKPCPIKYKGCLTQYNGEHVTRSCSDLGLTVCQRANKVEYCYCQGNLCNLDDKLTDLAPALPPMDDEDETEGSGSRETYQTTSSSKATKGTSPPSSAATQPTQKMTSNGISSGGSGWHQSSFSPFSLAFLPLLGVLTLFNYP